MLLAVTARPTTKPHDYLGLVHGLGNRLRVKTGTPACSIFGDNLNLLEILLQRAIYLLAFEYCECAHGLSLLVPRVPEIITVRKTYWGTLAPMANSESTQPTATMPAAFTPPASCQSSMTQWYRWGDVDMLGPAISNGPCFPPGGHSNYTATACPTGYTNISVVKESTLCCPRSVTR